MMIKTQRKSFKTSLANEVELTEAELEQVAGGTTKLNNIIPIFKPEGYYGADGSTQVALPLLPGWTGNSVRSDGQTGLMTEEEYGLAVSLALQGKPIPDFPLFNPGTPGSGVQEGYHPGPGEVAMFGGTVTFSQADINTAHAYIQAYEHPTTPTTPTPTTPAAGWARTAGLD